jgi:hypothetical protein
MAERRINPEGDKKQAKPKSTARRKSAKRPARPAAKSKRGGSKKAKRRA